MTKKSASPSALSRPAAPAPEAEFPLSRNGIDAWLPPALGALALVFAWLAALGGVSDGTLDFRQIFHIDTVRPHIMFRDLFVDGQSVSGWRQGRAPYYFPDVAFQWAMFALGLNLAAALYLFSLAQVAFAAVGWILVCDVLFGKSPLRRFAVLLLHAAGFVVLAWRGVDVFYTWLLGLFHYGAWAVLPWLLWLSLRALNSGGKRGKRAGPPLPPGTAAALAALLAVSFASDALIFAWFAAPAGFAALVLAWSGGLERRQCAWFVGTLAAGCVLGRAINILPGLAGMVTGEISLELGWEKSFRALDLLLAHYGHAAVRNPPEAAAWLAFVAVASWRAAAAALPKIRRGLPAALAVPPGPAHLLAALFVPASMLSALGAAVGAGLVTDFFPYLHPKAAAYEAAGHGGHYFIPAWIFPLFVGWALLPWGAFPAVTARVRAAVFAAFAAVLLAVAPKMARIDPAALDPFGTPFHQCFAENAKRLNWTGGVASLFFAALLRENPDAGVERMLPVGTFRRPQPGQSFMVVDIVWNSRISGAYQFFVLNERDGRVFASIPLAGERPCGPDEPDKCPTLEVNNYVVDERSVRAAFGAPAETIDCAGVRLLHYDPPLEFDFSHRDDPYLAPVARW